MEANELRKILQECLSREISTRGGPWNIWRDEKGQILYSGIDTLNAPKTLGTKRFYFLAFNPKRDGTNYPLHTAKLERTCWSAYKSQCWTKKHCDCDCDCDHAFERCASEGCSKIGEALHQRRVRKVLNELGLDAEKTFATNLIFVESDDAKELKKRFSEPLRDGHTMFDHCLESCWCVHKKMIAAIQPDYIVCLGNGMDRTASAFGFLHDKAQDMDECDVQFKERNNPKSRKRFRGSFPDIAPDFRPTLIGVLHPRFHIDPEGLREFIGS